METKTGKRIVVKGAYVKVRTSLVVALLCTCVLALPIRTGQAQRHDNDKPLDTKQIERLERQLSEIRGRIDNLRRIHDPHTVNVTEHLASRPPTKNSVIFFTGLFFANRSVKDDFRVGDRVLTIRRVNGVKQITSFGVVAFVDSDSIQFEVLNEKIFPMGDEVYVINREDTSASITNAFSP